MAAHDRVMTRSLSVFLAAVVAVLGFGLLQKVGAPSYEEALQALTDGDLDADARRATTRALLDLAMARGDESSRLVAAMAAVALNDAEAVARAGGLPGPDSPLFRGAAAAELVSDAGLGEPGLATLLAARVAEGRGDLESALRLYRQASTAAAEWDLPVAQRLAAASLARLD